MKFTRILTLTTVLTTLAGLAFGQVTSTRSSDDTMTPEVAKTQDAVNRVLQQSGASFKDGLTALSQDNRQNAGEKFNKAVEAFLESTLNVQSQPKLKACYDQLIDTVYFIEFPTDSNTVSVKVKGVSATCGWTVDNTLVETVAKAVTNAPAKTTAPATTTTAAVSNPSGPVPATLKVGFNSQEFEPSPLDDLSKIQLTTDEQDLTSPEAQAQYQYIQYAVANKSLGFTFQVHPMIQQFINYYRGRGRTTMEVGLYRSGMFMRMARRIFREEGVPENVAWLGQVESTWKPTALSVAAASGLWQFIPGTGFRFGLQRTAYVDERNSFDEATRASARYLKFLADRYHGNWELAMAAYNSGEGNVDRAVRRAGVEDFWAAFAYLPNETRNYVPNILATILIANNPTQYGFGHIRPAPPLLYDRVRVPALTNLSMIAQASDTTVQYLRYLNPHLRGNTTPPAPYIVNVPPGKANEVVAIFKRVPAAKINNTNVARTSAGETWQTISNRTGVSVQDLMAANPGMPQPKGKVIVPVGGNNVQTIAYTRPTSGPAVSGVKVVRAKAGDTVQKVAEREHANPTEVAKFNGLLPNSVLGAGREIKIPSN
ncbi:MAG: transglycosylase SLT domain-containing protein [Acidobacteria bacterium]|nr:transglycosylase SLT domain-containing protein [Acidobacteriota bacterium]